MNQKPRSIIVDDDTGNIITLKELLREYCPETEVTATASDIVSAFDLIQQQKPDLVFLDVEMPYGSGFDLLDKLLPFSFEVIFVTAYNDYAIKAFKYAAIDYILKPVNIDELRKAVQKVAIRKGEKNIAGRISVMLENLKPGGNEKQKIGLPVLDGIQFEDVSNIMRLRAEGSYTTVTFVSGKDELLVSRSLKEFEELLPPRIFCRVHHSHIINLNFIKKYYRGRGGYIRMTDDVAIQVSVRKKDGFFDKFIL